MDPDHYLLTQPQPNGSDGLVCRRAALQKISGRAADDAANDKPEPIAGQQTSILSQGSFFRKVVHHVLPLVRLQTERTRLMRNSPRHRSKCTLRTPHRTEAPSAVVSLVVVLSVAIRAAACDCHTLSTIEAWTQADIVFVGTVVSHVCLETPIRTVSSDSRAVTFAVDQSWKGSERTVTVLMPRDSGECGPDDLFVGQRYLVYATRGQPPGALYTHECLGTSELCAPNGGLMDVLEFETAGIPPVFSDGPVASEIDALCVRSSTSLLGEGPADTMHLTCADHATGGTPGALCGLGVFSAMNLVLTGALAFRCYRRRYD